MKLCITTLSIILLTSVVNANDKIRLIAFDAFPIFDPRPIFKTVKMEFPNKGDEVIRIWKEKQFSYTWLRVAGKQYKDFWRVTEDALIYATTSLGLPLKEKSRKKIMNAYLNLKPWPDVISALSKLNKMGIKLTFLSNFTEQMLQSNIENSGISKFFSRTISTNKKRTFKPDPRAYGLALTEFNVTKNEVLFVPFAAWDAAGSKWFGYRTFWANRAGFKSENLSDPADKVGRDLNDLLKYVKSVNANK